MPRSPRPEELPALLLPTTKNQFFVTNNRPFAVTNNQQPVLFVTNHQSPRQPPSTALKCSLRSTLITPLILRIAFTTRFR
jgi:hypothetical protein